MSSGQPGGDCLVANSLRLALANLPLPVSVRLTLACAPSWEALGCSWSLPFSSGAPAHGLVTSLHVSRRDILCF